MKTPRGFLWMVRLNHVTTQPGLEDLLVLGAARWKPNVVMLPKTESVSEVVLPHLTDGDVAPTIVTLIESGRGLAVADSLAAHKGFSLWFAKAVLQGRGSEFIDIARTNVPFLR
jgi:citrate lyase beta subunit